MGSDLDIFVNFQSFPVFQSTLPAWGATGDAEIFDIEVEFQSTLPAWGATMACVYEYVDDAISIHAPRMGNAVKLRGIHRVSCFFSLST